MRSIGFVSAKGGVAKSTTTINLAVGLARAGHRVLVVDTDPQGNCSYVFLRGEPPRHPTLYEVLIGDATAAEAIVPTHFDGVDLLPADAQLADAMVVLAAEVGRERRLRLAMAGTAEAYDFVLVDTAPTRSILTTNVLNFIGEIIVPITPGLFGLLGLGQIQDDVAQVRRYLENHDLRIGGILLTQTDRNTVHADVDRQLREMFGDIVFTAKIPRNIRVEEAHARHEPVLTFAPRSEGAKAYADLVKEVLSDGQRQETRTVSSGGNPEAHDAA
jgi:chromosome partitioning protein